MDAATIINYALPIVFVIVGLGLIIFLIEATRTLRKTRKTIDELQTKVSPTLDSVNQITNSLEPAVSKVDPMVERLGLTVDAVNLELMRVDQILEDVNDVTANISKTSNAIDSVTSAPVNLVNSVTERVRGALRGKHASPESAALAAAAAEHARLDDNSDAGQDTEQLEPLTPDDGFSGLEDMPKNNYFTYSQDDAAKSGLPFIDEDDADATGDALDNLPEIDEESK